MMHTSISGTRILVPLDGSELAERALLAAARLAQALGSTLVLARITRKAARPLTAPEAQIPLEVYQRLADDEARAAEQYLAHVAGQLQAQEISVESITQRGEAAPTLIDLLSSCHIGLVVMTTHARTGMARVALGSVADRLVRAGQVPVLLLHPLIADQQCDQQFDRALVPLDGSALSEAALEVVSALAGSVVHSLTLLRVVPHDGSQQLRREMEEANRYLDGVQARLAQHLAERAVVQTQVLGSSDPAAQIMQRASDACDLVIMATHGTTGTQRWVFGSVADRVLHDAATPLLLICPSTGSMSLGGYRRVGTVPQSAREHRPAES